MPLAYLNSAWEGEIMLDFGGRDLPEKVEKGRNGWWGANYSRAAGLSEQCSLTGCSSGAIALFYFWYLQTGYAAGII